MSHKGINLYKILIMNFYTLAKRDKSSDAQSDDGTGGTGKISIFCCFYWIFSAMFHVVSHNSPKKI